MLQTAAQINAFLQSERMRRMDKELKVVCASIDRRRRDHCRGSTQYSIIFGRGDLDLAFRNHVNSDTP